MPEFDRVPGADLHQHTGRQINIDGNWYHLLWADPEEKPDILVRVRTAERGKEYLVRAQPYNVGGTVVYVPDTATGDERWDNEPEPESAPDDLTLADKVRAGGDRAMDIAAELAAGLLQIAEQAMTDTYFQSDSRCRFARSLLAGTDQED